MLKARIKTWCIVIAVATILNISTSVFNDVNREPISVSVCANVSSDMNIAYNLSNKKFGDYMTKLQSDNADVFISDEEIVLDGYTKHENYLHSPLVLYALMTKNKSLNFIPSSDNNFFRIDLLSILTAMEQDLNWEDIGITSDVASGFVTLYIPNENCDYYNDVVDLFYLTLNGGVDPTEDDKILLKTRVENILSKCHKVSDIYQSINQEYQIPTTEHKVFIGPEYLLARKDFCVDGRYYNTFFPVYFLNTVQLRTDVWTKNTDTESNIGLNFLEEFQNNSLFLIGTGWRVKNNTYHLYLNSHTLLPNP